MLRSSEVAHDPYASLRFREYRAFLVAMGAVFAATQIQSAVLGWQVYALTGDPFALGLVGLAEALPFLGLTLVGGWAADRVDRRALSIASLVLVAASGAWLVALSVAPPRTVLPFYAAQALAGVGRAFFRPTAAALGAELVPREHYLNASTWRSSIHHSAMVVGPALGGGLIALGGPGLAYAVVLVLSAVGLLALGAIAPRPRRAAGGGHLVAELTDGIRFVFAHPLLLGAMSLDLFAVLFGGATALLPVFARDVLGVGEVGFGFLRAAPAAGSVLTAFALAPALARAPRRRRRARRSLGRAPLDARPARDAAGEDGPRRRREQLLHRLVERAGGVRERRRRAPARDGAVGRVRRRDDARHGRARPLARAGAAAPARARPRRSVD